MDAKTLILQGLTTEQRDRIIDAARNQLSIKVFPAEWAKAETLRFNLWTNYGQSRAYVQLDNQHKAYLNAADPTDLSLGNDLTLVKAVAAWLDQAETTPEPLDPERIDRELRISYMQDYEGLR